MRSSDDVFGSRDSALFPVLRRASIARSGTRGVYPLVGNEPAYRSVVSFWQVQPPLERGEHASKFGLFPRFRGLTRAQSPRCRHQRLIIPSPNCASRNGTSLVSPSVSDTAAER